VLVFQGHLGHEEEPNVGGHHNDFVKREKRNIVSLVYFPIFMYNYHGGVESHNCSVFFFLFCLVFLST